MNLVDGVELTPSHRNLEPRIKALSLGYCGPFYGAL